MTSKKSQRIRKKAVKKFRRVRKKAVKKFLKWKNTFLDFTAFYMIRCLTKLNVKVPNFFGRSFFSSRVKVYRDDFRSERIKPKNLRAKTRLRDDFIKKGQYPDPEDILKKFGSMSQHNEHQILLNLVKQLDLNDSEKFRLKSVQDIREAIRAY